jgi:hypothetical protein
VFATSYLHNLISNSFESLKYFNIILKLDGYETKQSYIIYEFVKGWIFFLNVWFLAEEFEIFFLNFLSDFSFQDYYYSNIIIKK